MEKCSTAAASPDSYPNRRDDAFGGGMILTHRVLLAGKISQGEGACKKGFIKMNSGIKKFSIFEDDFQFRAGHPVKYLSVQFNQPVNLIGGVVFPSSPLFSKVGRRLGRVRGGGGWF